MCLTLNSSWSIIKEKLNDLLRSEGSVKMRRSFTVNKNIKRYIGEMDKRTSAVADRAGIRRDVFSRIVNCKRPVYADEVIPIARAMGVSIESLFDESGA